MTELNPDITVYSFRRCPFAMRVRMVLHEKNIPFTTIEETLKALSPELLRLHPEGRVPVLVHKGLAIYESSIITEYLDDCFPQNPLMPKFAEERMQVREWTYWCNQIFKPEIDRYKYGAATQTADERHVCSEEIKKHLERIEARLSQNEWLVGDALSLADIHVFPFYRQLAGVTPEHPHMPLARASRTWLEKMTARPSFVKTMEKPA